MALEVEALDLLANLFHRYMRDKLVKDRGNNYYELFIEEKQDLIRESIFRINSGELTNDKISFAKYQIFLFSFEILIAKYSAGVSLDLITKEYHKSLALLIDGWEDSVVKLKLGNKVLDQYMLNQYCYLVWMISIAILINVKPSEFRELKYLIEKGKIKDDFILYLIESNTKSPLTIERTKTTYKPFSNLYKKGNYADINSSDIKKYLEGWYNNTKLLTWHNYVASIDRARYYYGYWSFESAAIVAILDLDDSSFRDNQYYPKDLVDYYRSNQQNQLG